MSKREVGRCARGLVIGMGIGVMLIASWTFAAVIYERHNQNSTDTVIVWNQNGFAVGASGSEVPFVEADGAIDIPDSVYLQLGSSDDSILFWDTAQTAHTTTLGLGSNQLQIMGTADVGTDLNTVSPAYPKIRLWDADIDNSMGIWWLSDDVALIESSNDLIVRQGTAASDVLKFQAYDTGSGFDDMITLTNSAKPSIAIASDGPLTIDSASIDGLGGYEVIFCGDLLNATLNYMGPATEAWYHGGADYSPNSTACDALDSTTEATADAPIFSNTTFRIDSMLCHVDDAAAANVVFATRSAAAATTPSITCTIAVGEQDCLAQSSTSTDIAAGATVAIIVTPAGDESLNDGWCKILISPQT